MELIINNSRIPGPSRAIFNKIAKMAARKNWIVSLSFVSKGKMKELNKRYRRKNKPTDVLSFNMNEGRILGDVIICPSVARTNAKQYGTSYLAELSRLLTHGLLHLLGHEHGKKMFDHQNRILKGVGYA